MKLEMFEIVGRCLFWREKKVLVVGDLHLGYEEVLNEQGMVFPKSQLSDYLEEFGKIFGKTGELNEIVLLGDIKHHFGGILRDESDGFYKLIEFFENNLDKNGKIVITEGNHDNILAPIVRRFDNVELKEGHLIENVLFFHGYRKFFEKNSKYFNKIDNKKDKIELFS